MPIAAATPRPAASCADASAWRLVSPGGDGRAAPARARNDGPVGRTFAWLLESGRLGLRYGRPGFVVQSVLRAACLLPVAGKLAQEL